MRRICSRAHGGGIDVGRSQQGREQMAAAKDVEGQIAVASVVAVEEAVLFLPVEGIVGGVEVENDLIGALGVGLQEQFHQEGLHGLGVVVVEVFIALSNGEDALGDEGVQAVLDPLGVAVIGEAVPHLASERQVLIHPAQQQGAGIGSDGTAVESSHDAASAGAGLIDNFRLWGSSPWRQMTAI